MHRFLALGDSYTIGEGVDAFSSWPNQLARVLVQRGVPVSHPEIIATTAWSSDELLEAIEKRPAPASYDIVSLLVGVNDDYRGRPVRTFIPEYRRLLARAAQFAAGEPSRVLAVSIPDWGATPFAAGRDRATIAARNDEYNESARNLAHAAGSVWIDVTTASRAMLHDPAMVAPDGLHPSAKMYGRWVEIIAPIASAVLAPDSAASDG